MSGAGRTSRRRAWIPLAGEPEGDHGLSVSALDEMVEALGYLGVRVVRFRGGEGGDADVPLPGPAGALLVEYPDPVSANRMGTRHAGNRRARITPPPGSPFTSESGAREVLAWTEENGYRRAMEALGIGSVATYYRRVALMREVVRENDARSQAGGDLLDERIGHLPGRSEALGGGA